MNPNVKKIYTVVYDNKVVVCETNLTAFTELFEKTEPESFGYRYYTKKFKEQKYFTEILSGKEYHFQQVYP